MKKLFVYLIILVLLPATALADSYSSLWKRVSEAQEKDLPKTQVTVLNEIIAKATDEASYGNLLKAQLLRSTIQTQIAPDSLDSEIRRLELQEATVKSPALKAVYASVLGKIYAQTTHLEDHGAKSKAWFAKSLADPAMLASQKSTDYDPAIVAGIDSKIFYDDLLHVLGIEAGNYPLLHDYYAQQGNRAAACLTTLLQLRLGHQQWDVHARKSHYLQRVDSLLSLYRDLDVAGEVAIEHYQAISHATDYSIEDQFNFINYALAHWGTWPRMNILRNAQSDLEQPSFNISIGDYMFLPNARRKIFINSIRNISQIDIKVYRVNVNGDTKLNPSVKRDYEKLQKLIVPGTVQSITRRYIGQPTWKENTDSVWLEGMPVGVYLIEATTDNSNIQPERALLRVSNLYVMSEGLPGDKTLYVVTSATTGKPISGAHLRVTMEATYRNEKEKVVTLTTDKNGEAIYDSRRYVTVYAYTDDDRCSGVFAHNGSYGYYNSKREYNQIDVFTDRSLYRPGQPLHVTTIACHRNEKTMTTTPAAHQTITFTLHNANGKEVDRIDVTTDDYGTASADFTLPSTGLTGNCYIFAKSNDSWGNAGFRVEEYKRPTYEVSFGPYKASYHASDTVRVKGVAKTYAGVPVQGAKVRYSVRRSQRYWWFRQTRAGGEELLTDSAVTADDGSFIVKMPMEYPDNVDLDRPVYYNISANAIVTDEAGEAHEGTTTLPLSNRTSLLTSDLPQKVLRDSLHTVTFTRQNLAGEPIPGTISYRVDGGEWKTAEANKAVALDKLSSGRHSFEAICEQDTLQQSTIVFSMSDHRPAIETHDWFYVSAEEFPANGKPVYLQVGSSDKDTYVHYTVFSAEKIIAKGTTVLNNEVRTRKLTYKEEYGDGLTITVAWVRHGQLYTHSALLRRPMPDRKLCLSWKSFRDKLTPGQKEEWTLTILSPDGKPAKAQLLATMYDKSLDAIYRHQWSMNYDYGVSLPYAQWRGGSDAAIGLYGFQSYRSLNKRDLLFNHFDDELFDFAVPHVFAHQGMVLMERAISSKRMAKAKSIVINEDNAALSENMVKPLAATMDVAGNAQQMSQADLGQSRSAETNVAPQLRENLQETAFFYPTLSTDAQGNVAIKFTLPESVTTWRFMGLAHDKAFNYGNITAEAVASKTVMVMPNLPRFIREGDKATIATRLVNTSERRVSGTTRLQFLDPETEKLIMEYTKPFTCNANATEAIAFSVNSQMLANRGNLFITRIIAEGRGFSDGEQHYLPVLPNRETVLTTVPFTQNAAGTKTIDLSTLFPKGTKHRRLTVEYTNNPAWLMIQAMPTLANPYEKNAVSLAAAIYANTLGQQILTSNPQIGNTIRLWQQETGKKTSLMSSLQKNEELKTMILSETPWVAEAEREADQKQQLAGFLDENLIESRLTTFTQKLRELQNPDGSFSWWPGMRGSDYMTMAVTGILTRLNTLAGKQQATAQMLTKAFRYLDGSIAEEVKELKKLEKKGVKHLQPSELACNYLYANALAARTKTADIDYLITLLDKVPTELTIYGKANSAVILVRYGRTKHAADYLQSLDEYTVYKEEMGRYYDTPKAYYSWFDYRIPTQVATIEALRLLKPTDSQTIEEMQRWLLQEKRTQSWDTPLCAVDAIYAFLATKDGKADMTKLCNGEQTVLAVDGRTLETPKATAGLGYVKTTVESPVSARTFTAEKTSTGTSWGALYAQYQQKATEVVSAASGIAVKREITKVNGQPYAAGQPLTVGDKITVRITLIADRDYDFVQVEDKRAACLEPVGQLSGYRWGYYISPRDNVTNYYFDRLAKGKHTVETDYYVEREGDYASGICTAQCAYSPEFSGREAAKELQIKD